MKRISKQLREGERQLHLHGDRPINVDPRTPHETGINTSIAKEFYGVLYAND